MLVRMTDSPEHGQARQFAALDLGSNSFHMVVAQESENGLLTVVDRIKQSVRLAAGLDEDGCLSDDAEERALACLKVFGERIRDLPSNQVRAVGTNTLRRAKDVLGFLDRAREALGHRVDVISGREEARLIYRGVVRDVESPGCLLVMDIGGGSTELIIGEGAEPTQLDSIYMGCVSWTKRYFPDGTITSSGMDEAILAARQELQSVVRAYRKAGWQQVVGSSGTIVAIERILQAKGYPHIDAEGLGWLRKTLIKAGDAEDVTLEGLNENRRPVIAGGVALLSALMQGLRIQQMQATTNALREGVLLELIGRERHADIREATVRHLMSRFEIDARQAFRVQQTALSLFDQVRQEWNLQDRHRAILRWGAALHETGMFMTFSGYHKHGAYMLTHTDMPGFSRQEQRSVAALVRGHRGKPTRDKVAEVAPMWDRRLLHLVCLLRIASHIHRRRSPRSAPEVRVSVQKRQMRLSFPGDWLGERPLSRADLKDDATLLEKLGYHITID
jgi:exopolyphosphatase/guanosine-5'-triphosphate,3'-diphosphate pyrophosphatase